MIATQIIQTSREITDQTAKGNDTRRAGSIRFPKKMTPRRKTALAAIIFLMFWGGVLVSTAKAQGISTAKAQGEWKIVPIPREIKQQYEKKGMILNEEIHPDGRKRSTVVEFFPGTKTPRSEQVNMKDGDLTSLISKSWNLTGDQISHSEEYFNKDGKLFEGMKWDFSVDGDGKIVGARTEKKYDPEIEKWTILETEFVPRIGWDANPSTFRGQIGQRITFHCSALPEGTNASVWGTGVYTDDSSVCRAAVHAGLIAFRTGGVVTIEIRPGLGSYSGSAGFGVTSEDWGSWGGSFIFVR